MSLGEVVIEGERRPVLLGSPMLFAAQVKGLAQNKMIGGPSFGRRAFNWKPSAHKREDALRFRLVRRPLAREPGDTGSGLMATGTKFALGEINDGGDSRIDGPFRWPQRPKRAIEVMPERRLRGARHSPH